MRVRRPPRRAMAGQGGFVLGLVLGAMVVGLMLITALLALSFTTHRAAIVQQRLAQDRRAADGALEVAVQEVRSGYTGNEMGAYVEFRDQKVAFFVRRLARGKHSVSYRLRAEIPGKFSALPARAYAMYAPELKANSDEIKLVVLDD